MIQPAIKGLVTREQWGAAPAKRAGTAFTKTAAGVGVHHGVSNPTSHADCIRHWRGYQSYHLRHPTEDYSDIAYQIGFCAHGYVFIGRGWTTQGGANGTRDANRRYASACYIGDGRNGFPEPARAALLWIIAEFRRRGAGLAVKPHRWFTPRATTCPTDSIAHFIAAYDGKPFTSGHSPAPEPTKEATMLTRLLVSGARAGETRSRDSNSGGEVSLLQRMLNGMDKAGLTVDGSFGPATEAAVKAAQKKRGLTVDGRVGPATRSRLNADWKAHNAPPPAPADPPANPYAGVTDRALLERIAKKVGA